MGGQETLSYDLERQRVEAFQHTIENLDFITTVEPKPDFTDEYPVEEEIKRFEWSIADTGTGLYLDPGVLAGTALGRQLQEEGEIPLSKGTNSGLELDALRTRGTRRSQHGVFFGKLKIDDAILPVAVKPHEIKPERTKDTHQSCFDDYFHNWTIKQLGFTTLQSAGIITGNDLTAPTYSMTIIEEGLTTLDSANWSNYFPDPNAHPGMREMWSKLSLQTALLHSSDTQAPKGSVVANRGNNRHGDGGARNVGTTPDGNVFWFDWENAVIKGKEPENYEERYQNSQDDLSTLVWSMCNSTKLEGMGMFDGLPLTGNHWWEGFCYTFFDDYKEARSGLAAPGRRSLIANVREELKMLEVSLRAYVTILCGIVKKEKLQKQNA